MDTKASWVEASYPCLVMASFYAVVASFNYVVAIVYAVVVFRVFWHCFRVLCRVFCTF